MKLEDYQNRPREVTWLAHGETEPFTIKLLTVQERTDMSVWRKENPEGGPAAMQCEMLRRCVEIFSKASDEVILGLPHPIPALIDRCMIENGFGGRDSKKNG